MFDFLTHNPVLAIFLIYFLFRLFFGKNDKAKKAMQAQRKSVQDSSPREQTLKTQDVEAKKSSFQERLEEAMRQAGVPIEQATASAPIRSSTAVSGTPPVQAVTAAADDPYAFHSLTERMPERVDYDQKQSGFEFRSATKEPVEQEYHLAGFTGFQEAQKLSRASTAATQVDTFAGQSSTMLDLFSGADDLRRAIILNEILGKPKSLRGRSL